jgi:hypothetical protein
MSQAVMRGLFPTRSVVLMTDEVDEVGRGAFKVRQTALDDRIGTLTA